jgi:hypothetical protein
MSKKKYIPTTKRFFGFGVLIIRSTSDLVRNPAPIPIFQKLHTHQKTFAPSALMIERDIIIHGMIALVHGGIMLY